VAGSDHAETSLVALLEAAGDAVVAAPPVLTDEDAEPVDAIARRCEHPLLAGARGSSVERARALAQGARTAEADVIVAFYLEGDHGLRWEYPELERAASDAGLPVRLLDHQPYDLRGLEIDV
jgi:hypothetical protein